MNVACTIVSPNYLHYARTLAKSYLAHHPSDLFFVLLVSRERLATLDPNDSFRVLHLEDLALPGVHSLAMQYDILELNTNVKPTLLKYLFREFVVDNVVYLDPDIFIYDRLQPIFDHLQHANVVLTPHITRPIYDGKTPTEVDFLSAGVFNLGFVALKRSGQSDALLDWWERRCLDEGYSEIRTGLFVDQKWMNLAPCLFEGVELCKDAGCNMAYWNLHERLLSKHGESYVVNGSFPLRFFHFSGVDVFTESSLSKYSNRYTLSDRPDLAGIFADYKAAMQSNVREGEKVMPYGYDRFSDGSAVTSLARRLYAISPERWPETDPFRADGSFYQAAKKYNILGSKDEGGKLSWKQFNPEDRRIKLIHGVFRTLLSVTGPVKYEALLKYLSHISILREQGRVILGRRS